MSHSKNASEPYRRFDWKNLSEIPDRAGDAAAAFREDRLGQARIEDASDPSPGGAADSGAPRGLSEDPEPRPVRWEDLGGQDSGWNPAGDGLAGGPGAVAGAKIEGDRLLAEARAEAEGLREEARRLGREEGRAEALRVLEEKAASLEAVVGELVGYKESLYQEAREQVIELSLALVGKLVGPLAEADNQAVVRVVEKALQRLSERETLTLRVHPEDIKSVVDAKPTILEAFDGIQRLTVMEDRSIRRGGCLVQTPTTEIDARLETQLQEIRQSLRKSG